jgi:hypothetical protein
MPNLPEGWGISPIHPDNIKRIKKQVKYYNDQNPLKKTNQTEVVNVALEAYFKKQKYV